MNIQPASAVRSSGPAAASLALAPPAWLPELAGLSSVPSEDLGQGLTEEQRRGLQAVLDRLEARGVRFLMPQGSIFSRDLRPMPAKRLLAALAQARPHYLDGLHLDAPGHPRFESTTLGHLAGAAQFLLGPDDLLKRSIAGLAAQGYAADPLAAYAELLGTGNMTVQFYRDGNLETYLPRSLDAALACNALAGDGSLAGVADPGRLRRLGTAIEQGWLGRGDAFHSYLNGGRVPLVVKRGLPPLKVREEDLDAPDAVGSVAKRYVDAYNRYVLPAVQRSGYSADYAFHDEVHSPDGRASLEARLESFGVLLEAAEHIGSDDLRRLHQELLGRYPSSLDLVAGARRLAPTLRQGDPQKAMAALESLGKVAPSTKNLLYDELVASTGSHEAAREGVNLVRIPVVQVSPEGQATTETQETRTRVYRDLATALPEADRGLAPEIYQGLLIGRPAAQSLAEAGANLRSLVVACSSVGFPLLAPALFEALGTSEGMERRVAMFEKTLAAGGRLQDALESLDAPRELAITVEGDSITIGGVVIPRR